MPVDDGSAATVRDVTIVRMTGTPSTEHHGRRGRHQVAVDPDEPSLLAFEFRAGEYAEVAHVAGTQPATFERPFPVTMVPAELRVELDPL